MIMKSLPPSTNIENKLIQSAYHKNIPINGSFELTPLCNMDCEMCYVRLSPFEMHQKGRLLTVNEWLKIAEQLKESGLLFLLLSGGEPLLYPGFKELYLKLKEMGLILTINTNATLIDDEWASFFSYHPPRRINITLYGSNNETYRNLCHMEKGFDKALHGIQLLKEKGLPIKLASTFTKINFKDADSIFMLADELDLPLSCDTCLMPAARERTSPFRFDIRLSALEAAELRIRFLRYSMDAEHYKLYAKNKIDAIEHFIPDPNPHKVSCLAGHCSFTVNWQGNARPCVMMTSPSCSLLDHNWMEAWEYLSSEISRLSLDPKCQNCKFRPLCEICAANSYLESGSYQTAPSYLCDYAKLSYLFLLRNL